LLGGQRRRAAEPRSTDLLDRPEPRTAAMQVAIVGLGYVGSVTGACLADAGHDVTLVDVNPLKIAQLNAGESPIAELGLQDLIGDGVERDRLRATDDIASAVKRSDVVIVCVGTPTAVNGDVRLDDVITVSEQIGDAIADARDGVVILVTSTVPPGTVEGTITPILEARSGRVCGEGFGVGFSPEFLREGSAINDFRNPPKTVIGTNDEHSFATLEQLFSPFASSITRVPIPVAETVKLADNAWHALKVTFANEIGRFCDANGVDSHDVMTVFKSDTRLNISTAYLTPGFAFGGSCLPKDLRTVTYRARAMGVRMPVLDSVLGSNREHIAHALRKIEALPGRKVAMLGIAFKSGTDDLRESPMLELVERLLGKGYEVCVHDEHVNLAKLVGANREYVLNKLPHIASLLTDDLDAVVDGAEIIVIAHSGASLGRHAETLRADQHIVDLSGAGRASRGHPNYGGLTW
jgi:GDP-mannose 6-dehydrogenase